MNQNWTAVLRPSAREVTLLVTCPAMGDVMKARLPMAPRHPRALLTMLEGVALFGGGPLCVAISAAQTSAPWLGSGLFGDELWPAESPLVRFTIADRGRHRPLRGLGSFQHLRGVRVSEPT
ncbi:MAG: hypothetical protein NVS3B20_17080 [Polyangiales bacterium]